MKADICVHLNRKVKPYSTYIHRVQSSVWRPRTINPRPLNLSPPSECISEDARHWIGLLQVNPSTGKTIDSSIHMTDRKPRLVMRVESAAPQIPQCWSMLVLDPETEFLDVIGIKVLRVFPLALHSHLS
jgi:hypothetical protein